MEHRHPAPVFTTPSRRGGEGSESGFTRRAMLAGAAGLMGAVSLPAWPAAVARADGPNSTGITYEDHPQREPSSTHVVDIDGLGVAFAYGQVIPSFDGWARQEQTRCYQYFGDDWRFSFDPDAVGEGEDWASTDFDDSTWSNIAVPSTWDLLDTPGFADLDGGTFGQGTAFVDGFGWYRRRVRLDHSWEGRVLRLCFLGVGHSADVWFDGEHLGKHEGANGPFALTLPESAVTDQEHVLAVRVYRRASYPDYTTNATPIYDDRAVPCKPVDYWPYAGITRPVWLEGVSPVSIAKLLVKATTDGITLHAIIENRSNALWHGRLTIDGRGWRPTPLTVPAHSAVAITVQRSARDLSPWSPGNPALHELRAELHARREQTAVDSLTTTFGVRDIRIEGAQLLVSNDPVFAKGMNWHEESAGSGRAMTAEEIRTELHHLLDLGVGILRNSVYGRHPAVYDWADEHGILVMDDLETMWLETAQQKLQTETYGLTAAMATTMAWTQHNHPCVVLWGLQNESEIDEDGAPIYRAWISQMKDAVRAVDLHSRPVTWASSTSADPAFDLADVIGFNEYFGYFYGETTDLGPTLDEVHSLHPDSPILITENGAWATPGTHGDADDEGTEEWQAQYHAEHWSQVAQRRDFMTGYCAWVLKDYKQRGGYNQEYNGISVMGMLAFDGTTRKAAYRAFRELET